jgi:hypothetical protein
MGERKYSTVAIGEGPEQINEWTAEPEGQYGVVLGGAIEKGPLAMLRPGTYALVPIPEGERMVVVVTEGGKWPEWAVTGSGTGADLGYDWMREVLDALAEGSE